MFDKIISLYQGRAVTLHEFDIKTPSNFFDLYEEQEPWTPFAFSSTGSYTSSPSYSVSTFKELCSLSVLMVRRAASHFLDSIVLTRSIAQGRIITAFYAESKSADPLQQLDALNASLGDWSDRLPSYLRYDPSQGNAPVPPPHVLSL